MAKTRVRGMTCSSASARNGKVMGSMLDRGSNLMLKGPILDARPKPRHS